MLIKCYLVKTSQQSTIGNSPFHRSGAERFMPSEKRCAYLTLRSAERLLLVPFDGAQGTQEMAFVWSRGSGGFWSALFHSLTGVRRKVDSSATQSFDIDDSIFNYKPLNVNTSI
jgi:hypothetical protein